MVDSPKMYLDVFYFSIKKIKEKRPVRNRNTYRIITEDTFCPLQSFYNVISPNDNILAGELMKLFISNFDKEFLTNKDNSKAISIPKGIYGFFKSDSFCFGGGFEGGITGRTMALYDSSDASRKVDTIDKKKVTASTMFYLIWIPRDSLYGVLMIQKFSNMNCSSSIKDAVHHFFVKYGFKPFFSKYLPKEVTQNFLKDCILNRITIRHQRKVDNDQEDDKLPELKQAKLTSTISNFSISLDQFFKNNNLKEQIVSFVDNWDENYRDGDEVKLHYVNSKGESANAKLEEADDIIPSIILSDRCYDIENDIIDFANLQHECLCLLNKIQSDNSYYPNEND
ncbi:MAG: hypothetical protein PUC21_00395 [Bacteroidales bacterium]|nr:hypothetical protein [Bacteroidales bacterium]